MSSEKQTLFFLPLVYKLDFFLFYQGDKDKSEAEFKELEPRLKYGWFHLKSYLMFQALSWHSIETGFGGFETRHSLNLDTELFI